MNQLSVAHSTKDIELAECLAKLRGETNNNNNNNNNNNSNNNNNFLPFLPPPPPPPTPPPSPPDGGDGESDNDNDGDDDNRNLTPTQRFLLDQLQRTAVAVGTNNAAVCVPLQGKKLDFLKTLVKSFLKQSIYLYRTINQKY